ncbi:MAG: DUF2853 family protein [Epsilonproteobacteria bacterium]|nr:DUF2853 family protein [Campylobacterota bacterium]
MSKFDEKVALYLKENERLNLGLDKDLIIKVARSLGPAIYRADAETVSCSDKSEADRLRKNFLKKKLELDLPDEELNKMIKEVCDKLGTSNRRKYRALFYALLAKMNNKEGIFA